MATKKDLKAQREERLKQDLDVMTEEEKSTDYSKLPKHEWDKFLVELHRRKSPTVTDDLKALIGNTTTEDGIKIEFDFNHIKLTFEKNDLFLESKIDVEPDENPGKVMERVMSYSRDLIEQAKERDAEHYASAVGILNEHGFENDEDGSFRFGKVKVTPERIAELTLDDIRAKASEITGKKTEVVDKIEMLQMDLAKIKFKYDFDGDKYEQLFNKVCKLIDKIDTYINEQK